MYRPLGQVDAIATLPISTFPAYSLPDAPPPINVPVGTISPQENQNAAAIIGWEGLPQVQQALYTPPPGYTIVGQQQAAPTQQVAPVVASGLPSPAVATQFSTWLNTGRNKLYLAAAVTLIVVALAVKKRRR